MGTVYEALDRRNGNRVAVKTIARDSSSDMVRRFEREAKILRQLNHPNIVRFYDSGREERWLYLAMEFLDGLTLEDLLKRKSKLDIDLVLAISKPITDAAHYIHEKGFVRNDIKPNNIILTNAGRVCLLDFGISRPAESSTLITETREMFHTGTYVVIGTIQFMAPEQLEPEHFEIDRRADIYAFGVVLYRMLTGVYPFGSGVSERFAHAHGRGVIRPPSDHAQLPAGMDAVVLKCLKYNPMERFQTMLELQQALYAAAGEVKPVDLRKVVADVGVEVQEVQAMDGRTTLQATWNNLLRAIAESRGSDAPGVGGVPISDKAAKGDSVDDAFIESESGSNEMSRLSLLEGNVKATEWHGQKTGPYLLLNNKVRVGRSSDNDLVLRDELLSRYHAEFDTADERWFIQDLNSGLGTIVNNERILTRTFLRKDDLVQFGSFIYRFG